MKVNWDASLNLKAGMVGLGCVIRDEDGFVVGAKCSGRDYVCPLCFEILL
jgi:hypothetical protein